MIRDHRAAVAVPIDPWPVGARSETGEGGPGRDGTGGRLGAQRRSVLTGRPPLVIVARDVATEAYSASCTGGASCTPADCAPTRSRWSQTANSVFAAPTASRLARCTASAPRKARWLASCPARTVTDSVSSTALVAAQ